MSKPLYIYSSSYFLSPVDVQLPNLKTAVADALGKSMRRIDRLTQLALIGCFQCKGARSISENTGLYLSSINGSLNNMTKLLAEMYDDGDAPRPLSFINTVSNSACYYLARELNVLAYNQFVNCNEFSFEATIKLAQLDLQLGKVDAALMGVISEVGPSFEIHRQRIDLDEKYGLCEGSHWLYLGAEITNETPVAEVVKVAVPVSLAALKHSLLDSIDAQVNNRVIVFGDNVEDSLRCELVASTSAEAVSFLPESHRHESLSAIQITGFLSQRQGDQMIYIDCNGRNQYSLVIIRRV